MPPKNDWLNLILHAHLPYVNHPEQVRMLEESWLFEAMLECYLPLIRSFDRLLEDNVPYRLTLSLSPTLISMLQNPGLQQRFQTRLQQLQTLAVSEVTRTQRSADFYPLACMYQRMLAELANTYDNYQGNLLNAFKKHRDAGRLELITTAATHAFLPLLSHHPVAVNAQLQTGIRLFEETFEQKPAGLWLPECGYYPGLEKILAQLDISYCFVENHAIYDALPIQKDRDVYQPVLKNGLAFFGRDPESSEQVWSNKVGYPADNDYREYYRDIGLEFEQALIEPYLIDGITRSPTGFKYYRITGDTEEKLAYHHREASQKASQHAADFIECKQFQFQRLNQQATPQPAIITAPFDAELFGHWWFEGPLWLEQVIRRAAKPENSIRLGSASEYLSATATSHATATPAASSWGAGGYNQYWLNENNEWIYPLLDDACRRMENLANHFAEINNENKFTVRLLQQAARTLMLAQSSDWPFILQSGSSPEYAKNRLLDHLARFNYLEDCLLKGYVEEEKLQAIEQMDQLFPNIDFRLYQTQ